MSSIRSVRRDQPEKLLEVGLLVQAICKASRATACLMILPCPAQRRPFELPVKSTGTAFLQPHVIYDGNVVHHRYSKSSMGSKGTSPEASLGPKDSMRASTTRTFASSSAG